MLEQRKKNRWKEEGRNESQVNSRRAFKMSVGMEDKFSPWSAEVQEKDPIPSCFRSWRGSKYIKATEIIQTACGQVDGTNRS